VRDEDENDENICMPTDVFIYPTRARGVGLAVAE
jgi:hypothetical protein